MNVKLHALISIFRGRTTVPWKKQTYFYLHSKGTMLALLLSQKDMNPGLQLYLCKVPLMDDNGFGSTSRGKKVNFCLFLIPKDIQILFCLFFLKVVLHSILNKRCTVLSCNSETMWSTAVMLLSLHLQISPSCTELHFVETPGFCLRRCL